MMSLNKYKMRSWLLAVVALVSICTAIGLVKLTMPEAEAAGSGSLKVGSNYYSTWEEAVAAAGSSGTIVVMEDFTFPSSPKDYRVPVGVTLLLPYDTSVTSVNSASANHPYANEKLVNSAANPGNPENKVSVTMTIPEGVTLYVYGKLIVGGTIGSAAGTLWSGGTTGAHANLQVDGTVDLRNSAIMAVTGYVTGSGTVKAEYNNAKIYEPMAVEYRGGHHTAGVADSLSAHSGEGKLCPFFQWSIQNIRTNVVLKSSSSLYVYVDLYALSEHNTANACFAGSSGAFLNLSSGTTLYSSYDDTKPTSSNNALYAGRKNIRLDGSATTASLTIPTSVMTVESKNYNFPIPYNFHITVESGTLSVATKTQLLPGARLEIKEKATLNVASELFVYTGANDFTATASASAVTLTYPNKNNKNLIYPSTQELQAMEGENGAANLIVDGKMTFFSGGKFAGVVQTNGTGEINTTNMATGTLKRSWGGAGKFTANCDTRYMAGETVRTLSPMLYSTGSGTVTTMVAGKTYYGTGAADSHTINTIQYTLYYSSSGSNKTYTEPLNAEVVGSWGDTLCTIIPAKGGQVSEDGIQKVYLMNGADISALGYYSSPNLGSENLVKKYAGEATLYKTFEGQTYTVTWKDEDGTELCQTTVLEGALPSYTGPNLDYYEENGTPYGPTGWEPEIAPATGDITYTAKYDTVEAQVQDPDGRIWYINQIGDGRYNFSTIESKGCLKILNGSTVTLLKDVTGRVCVGSDNLTLDLNGHTLTAQYVPAAVLLQKAGIKFTLTNSGTSGGIVLPDGVGYGSMRHAGVYFNSDNCELLIHNVKINANANPRGFAVYSGREGNRLTLDDATLIGSIGGVYMDNAFALNIMGSTSVEAIVPIYCALNDYQGYTATLNISGGTFASTGSGQVYFTDDTETLGPGLPLDDVAGSALVLDYTHTKNGVSISDGIFRAFNNEKKSITLVYKDDTGYAVKDPLTDGAPSYFATGGYYSDEISSRFYKRAQYSCVYDEEKKLWHVLVPTFDITWKYNSLMNEEARIVLKTDTGVPKGTQVEYRPDGSTSEYKDLPPYTDEKTGIIYGFTGWSPALAKATKAETYTAVYSQVNAKVESTDGTVKYILLADSKISTYGVAADDTVTLLTDVTTRPNIDVPITFDLNGHTLNGSQGYWMAVYIDPKTGNNVTITNSKDTGGIYMPVSTAPPSGSSNPYAAIALMSGNLTLDHVTVSGGSISYKDGSGTTYTNDDGIYNGIPLDSFGVYSKSGSRCNLTLIDTTITGHNGGVYMDSQAQGLMIQGNTTIKAAVPIYCSTAYYPATGVRGSLRIESGTFESTGGNPAYYKDAAGNLVRLPNSALVIDYANTSNASENDQLDVLIFGGTFKGHGEAEAISLIEGYSSTTYSSATHVPPEKFVSGGYFSTELKPTYYDTKQYVCDLDADLQLYRLGYPIITWLDSNGTTVLHRQEVPMGEVPKYNGPAEKLEKNGTYVTSWTPTPDAVTKSTSYMANFGTAKAKVIAPDGSITYYATVSNNTASSNADSTAVFYTNSSYVTVKNLAVPDGSTVQLLTNLYGTTRITGKITLDLNGKNIWGSSQYVVLAGGGSKENPAEIKIINREATGGQITARGMIDSGYNGNEGVIVVKDYTTITLEGLEIITCTDKNNTVASFAKDGIGVQSSGAASSVTIKDTTITAGSVGVYVSSANGSAAETQKYFQGLTIEGENTSISAATPVYCMGANLSIKGGTFTSTGVDGSTHSAAYYHPQGTAKAYLNLNTENTKSLPLSALVIDKSTSPKVSISGGTFRGYDTTDPISIVAVPRTDGTTGTDPKDFVTGGYYNQDISKDYYKEGTYSSVKVEENLYQIVSGDKVSVTFDLNKHGTSSTAVASNGGTVARPTPDPTHPGFTFGGWYKEPECTTEWDFNSDTVTTGTTIYAKWTPNNGLVQEQRTSLTSGSTMTLMESNYVKNNKHLYVAFDVSELGSGSVRFGHGTNTQYSSAYVDLTATDLTVKKYSTQEETVKTYTHNLPLSGRVEVQIDVGVDSKAAITLSCGGKEYKLPEKVTWLGSSGDIYVKPTDITLTNVDAHWWCDDYDSDIWFFGDSWFSYDRARWPYYFYQDGYTDYLFSGCSGMGSEAGLDSFKHALKYGTPKYAVWCMGMNDPDSGIANPDWMTATQAFIKLCQDNEITPILTTIPSGSTRDHSYKNAFIRGSSVAYVDVERAVIADRTTNEWYTGFAENATQVHPSAAGAQQIYIEIVEKLLAMKALTSSGTDGTILQATAKKASDIWHGNTQYWINAGTGKFYSDANGNTVTTRDSVMIHNWGAATYTWDGYSTVTAKRICKLDDSHTETEEAKASVTGYQEATCTEDGSETYTAKFTNSAFATQTKSKSIPALGCVAHIIDKNGAVSDHVKTLQSAVSKVTSGSYIQMVKDSTESDVTISNDVYLDLNGYKVTGTITVADDATLYGMDKSTDGYQDARGSIQITSGTVAAAAACPDKSGKVYAAYTQNGTTTFNRVAFPVTRYYVEALANGKLSVGFEGTFRGNANAVMSLSQLGFAISKDNGPEQNAMTAKPEDFGARTVRYTMSADKASSYSVKGLLQFDSIFTEGIEQTVNIKEVLTAYYKSLDDNLPGTAKVKAILEQFINPQEGTA